MWLLQESNLYFIVRSDTNIRSNLHFVIHKFYQNIGLFYPSQNKRGSFVFVRFKKFLKIFRVGGQVKRKIFYLCCN